MRLTRLATALALFIVLVAATVPVVDASQVLRHGSRERHWVALTFDDGWSASRCGQIANTLRSRNVTATFLINGSIIRRDPARWRRILHGFPLANHTLTHAWLDRLSEAGIRREIHENEVVIERALGRQMLPLMRPPYGAYDSAVVRVADALGYRTVLWDVDSADTASSSVSTVIASGSRGINGSIVLMHCGPAVTPAALGSIISSYRARGFRFVDLGAMLGLGASAPSMACRVRNRETGVVKGNLAAAVRVAHAGQHLVLRGTCRGTTWISKALTVKGTRTKRSGLPTLAGMDHGPVITIAPGVPVRLVGITVRGGAAGRAAGILNRGRLTLLDVVVRGNKARGTGGGIVNLGRLELFGATSIRGNRAADHAGGVMNRGTLVLGDHASITRNVASGRGGGLDDNGVLIGVTCGGNIRNNSPDDCAGA